MKVLSGKDIPPGLLETLDSEQPMLISRDDAGQVVLLSLADLPLPARLQIQDAMSEYIRQRLEQIGETPESIVEEFYRARKAGG